MNIKDLNPVLLGGLFIVSLISVVSLGYTYTKTQEITEQAKEIQSLKETLELTRQELADSRVQLQELSSKLGTNESKGESILELDGDVYGPISNTKIGDDVIDDSNIVDHSIGESEVNSSEVQLRVVDECPNGYYIRSIDENGHTTCGKPEVNNVSPDLDLEDVLLNGNDANNRDIEGVDELEADKVKTDELCLSGDCKVSWPIPSSTPGLSAVLSEDNNANNMDINGVKDLYASNIYPNQLCLDSQCEEKWPEAETTYYIKTHETTGGSYAKTYLDKDYYGICVLSGIVPKGSDPSCWITTETHYWVLNTLNAECFVTCFKVDLNYS